MKKIALIAIAAALVSGVSQARETVSLAGVTVDSATVTRNGKLMSVDISFDFSGLKVDGNRAVLITPCLVNGNDSISLPAVGVYGRRRYYTYVRNGKSMLSGDNEITYRASQKPDNMPYRANVDYREWMNGATLSLRREEFGCCNSILDDRYAPLAAYSERFFPDLVYVRPQAELTKSRSLEGSAFIDFPVDQTVIYPDYRRNTVELGKIQATIDSVRSDRDVTITQVWLKGFASPESPYAHNKDLAIGRTAALKAYIQKLYHFADGIIVTDYEPEDWAGLRRFVEQSNISHRSEILDIIDSDREPDNKEWYLKSTYPDEYRFLLHNSYPALRHTDYRIAYNIRTFNDVDEIRRIMAERPQKLSLNEFYLVAQEYEPGTDDFTEVFETAVRMFPADATANLNAANAAIRRDDFVTARRYLDKAGDSPEATYARAALAIRMEQYDEARRYLRQAADAGLTQAATTLEELNHRNK